MVKNRACVKYQVNHFSKELKVREKRTDDEEHKMSAVRS